MLRNILLSNCVYLFQFFIIGGGKKSLRRTQNLGGEILGECTFENFSCESLTLDNKILSLKHLVKHYAKFREVENFELRKYCIPISTSRNQVILAGKFKNIDIEFTFARIISLINSGRLSTVRHITIDIKITLEFRGWSFKNTLLLV